MTTTTPDAIAPPTLTIHAIGTPAPQGSKRGFVNKKTGRVQMVESSKKVAPWRQDVQAAAFNAAADHQWAAPTGPLRVHVVFYLPRLRAHYRTGRFADRLRDDAPTHSQSTPDIDKLLRSTFDALTQAGVIQDDAQIAAAITEKRYANPGAPTGATITITPLELATPTRPSTAAASDEGLF